MHIDFQDQTNTLLDQQLDVITNLLNFAAERELVKNDAELSVSFVDNKAIQELNKTYRGKDQPTDVISFALQDEVAKDVKIIGDDLPLVLGDIVVSVDKVTEQAKAYQHSFERELAFLVIHGFLHLLGYDHLEIADEKMMFEKQTEILGDFGIER